MDGRTDRQTSVGIAFEKQSGYVSRFARLLIPCISDLVGENRENYKQLGEKGEER